VRSAKGGAEDEEGLRRSDSGRTEDGSDEEIEEHGGQGSEHREELAQGHDPSTENGVCTGA
jgi:hypothetical protein